MLDTLQSQLNDSTSDNTQFSTDSLNNGEDKVIHEKSHKVLKEMSGGHLTKLHIEDFAGLFPVWPIVEFALAPSGASKDERMTQYVQCVLALFGETLLVDEKAVIAPIKIMNDKVEDLITDKANIPSNFAKLGKWLMMSGGSWVFNKANNNVYACFHPKSTIPVEEMVPRVSIKFSPLGSSKLYKKQNQAIETETPMMLLFISNSTDPLSITSDITQMLETAHDSIEMDGMIPEEFDYMEIPKFTLKLNAPRLPSQTKQTHKGHDYFKEQGKKAFHCKVAKDQVPFFCFLGGYAHRLGLEVKYFGKFAKFTKTLANNVPLSDSTKLCQCMQGHLNVHLSSTLLVLNRIDNLDVAEILHNTDNSSTIAKVTLCEMLYQLKLENGSLLFLQLTQRPSGEFDAIIPNTPEAELKAERINQQVGAWCINYWMESNPGGAAFYPKLANHAFNQALLHKVSKFMWDSATQTVTSPGA